MPDDRETWRLVARGLDESAQLGGHDSYAAAPDDGRVGDPGRLRRRQAARRGLGRARTRPARGASSCAAALSAFYSHPWAWNEIGFGGPSYPRGYARMGVGLSEAWEGAEALDVDPVPDVKRRGLE